MLCLIFLSPTWAGENKYNKSINSIKTHEGYFTTPSIGCVHKWNSWRVNGFEQISEVNNFDSLPSEMKQNLSTYLDSAIGKDWDKILNFVKLDISKDSNNKSNPRIIYTHWFTFNTSDTIYYCPVNTDSAGTDAFFKHAYIIKNSPKRIRSLANFWKVCIDNGAVSQRARPLEIFLKYNKETDQFNWVVYYYKGFSYLLGPKYLVSINAESGKILEHKKT